MHVLDIAAAETETLFMKAFAECMYCFCCCKSSQTVGTDFV